MAEVEAQAPPYSGADGDGGSGRSESVDLIDLYWSVARFDLGLTDEEFLEQTPRTLDLLMRRLERSDLKHYHIAAQNTAILATANCDRKQRPDGFDTWDFIPRYLWPDAMREQPRFDSAGNVAPVNLGGMSAAQSRDFLKGVFGVGTGKKAKKRGAAKQKGS